MRAGGVDRFAGPKIMLSGRARAVSGDRFAGAYALYDQPVMLGAPVLGKIEHVLPEVVPESEIAARDDHFVLLGHGLRSDLPGRRDDA